MSAKCIYYVEGSCEQQLVSALKQEPAKLIPGRVRIFNVIQNRIPNSQLISIAPGTTIVFVFDTDKPKTDILNYNIAVFSKHNIRVKMVLLMQVMNIEDELVRATDVKAAPELTRSRSVSNFKSDFCKLAPMECRRLLERHHINVDVLWTTPAPAPFDCYARNDAVARN